MGSVHIDWRRNSVWSIAEVVVNGITLFVLYKYVVATLGLEALGVWSLVFATATIARIGDLALSAGVSRFVAVARAQGDDGLAWKCIETAFLANLILYATLAVSLFFPLAWGLGLVMPADRLGEAQGLLPYAIASFVLFNLYTVVASALIGCHRTDLKAKVAVASGLVQVLTVFLTMPRYGLVGMGLGQILQYSTAIGAGWLICARELKRPLGSVLPMRLDRAAFRQLFGFGIKMQAAGLTSFAFEPLTKFVMSSVAGLEALGLYEMAARMVLQVRHLVVAPMQSLVPAFAHLRESDPAQIPIVYEKAVAKAILFGAPALLGIGLLSPLVSLLWIGEVNRLFVIFACLLIGGWFFNVVSGPAYHLAVSRGLLRWNILGHLVTTIGGPALGLLLGPTFGAEGVAAAAALALCVGCLVFLIMNSASDGIPPLPSVTELVKEARAAPRLVVGPWFRGQLRI